MDTGHCIIIIIIISFADGDAKRGHAAEKTSSTVNVELVDQLDGVTPKTDVSRDSLSRSEENDDSANLGLGCVKTLDKPTSCEAGDTSMTEVSDTDPELDTDAGGHAGGGESSVGVTAAKSLTDTT